MKRAFQSMTLAAVTLAMTALGWGATEQANQTNLKAKAAIVQSESDQQIFGIVQAQADQVAVTQQTANANNNGAGVTKQVAMNQQTAAQHTRLVNVAIRAANINVQTAATPQGAVQQAVNSAGKIQTNIAVDQLANTLNNQQADRKSVV